MVGLGDGFLDRLIRIESGGNPSAWNRLPSGRPSRYRGLAQFGPEQESQFGITDQNWMDPTVQRQALTRHVGGLQTQLRSSLGREPTEGEVYLAHQQGPTGGRVLLQGGTTPAWQAIRPYYRTDRLAQLAITGNIPRTHAMARTPVDQITSQDFANLWTSRFPGAAAVPSGVTPAVAPAAPSRVPLPPTPAAPPTPTPGPSMTQPMPEMPDPRQGWAEIWRRLQQGLRGLSMPPQPQQMPDMPDPREGWAEIGRQLQQRTQGFPDPSSAFGVPPMRPQWGQPEQPEQPPALESTPPVAPRLEAPLPITPPDADAIMAGATAAQANRPPERGFMDKLEGGFMSPLTAAGLQLLFPQSNLAGAMQGAQRAGREQSEYNRQREQRSVMDRIWSEAFPNGQPNMQHPLIQGMTPQTAALFAGMGPEQAIPMLAQNRLRGGKFDIKDGFLINESTGQVVPLQGGGRPPSGYRWGQDGQQLEPIPGGPAEQIPSELAGRMALAQVTQRHLPQARDFYLNRLTVGESARHALGGAMLAPDLSRAQRAADLGIETAIRAASGANAPEAEVQRYIQTFTPKVTDPIEVRRQKLDMLQEFLRSYETNITRGRGGTSSPAAGADGFSIRRLQ